MNTRQKKNFRRIAGAYISSVISISLVLMLVGVASLLIVNARNVSDYFKESLQISILMKQEVSELKADAYRGHIEKLPYVHTARLVTREEGTAELKKMLGDDFLSVFESSPVPISIDVTLEAEYVVPDSMTFVTARLMDSPLVDEISCQQSLVEVLNANLSRISLILSIFIALMLFVSFVLIGNTVRINIFARRFTIHTMQLVGATRAFVRRPFMWDAVLQGLTAALVAVAALGGGLAYVKKSFQQLFEVFNASSLAMSAMIVVVSGILICMVSTFFTVNRLVDARKDDLYV